MAKLVTYAIYPTLTMGIFDESLTSLFTKKLKHYFIIFDQL